MHGTLNHNGQKNLTTQVSIDRRWINNVVCLHAGISLSFKEGGHSDTGLWMNLEDIVPREVSRTQKHRGSQGQGEQGGK